jgi:spoIIIJ-associated protein
VEDEVEFSGRTVEDAIAAAVRGLGFPRDQLEFKIITKGSRGVFGLGADDARISARAPAQPASARQEFSASLDERTSLETTGTHSDVTSIDDETEDAILVDSPAAQSISVHTENGDTLVSEARHVLDNLLQKMGFDAEVELRSSPDPIILAINGSNLGALIGRRGDNLAALQFMVNLILSRNRRQWPRIVVDVENYRSRREESLRSLAERIAYRVRRNQRAFTLEAMTASDRRIVHLTLRDRSDIETYSIGEGVSRRVVIALKRSEEAAASPD